ncbi:MFS transporter [Pseudonocardia nigra]|uniref:MFS transporter n=1 Tax=Pseudonocardia nigra TaxID=1921578 RepID=UPI001C5F977D|nr:MFS transporter [Pseudonocardia nigra]
MTDLVPLRRNTQFQLLWAGSVVSQLGSELTRLALPLLVLALTGSPGWAGIVTGAGVAAAVLVQMPAGVWVDRWDRRRTLITGQAVRTVNSAVLAALILTGQVRVWQVVVLAVVDGLCVAFAEPARTTSIRAVVPVAQLPLAYMQEESRAHAARLVGPPLGGLLYGLGRAVPFVADTVTFLVALLCSIGAKVPRRPAGEERAQAKRSMRRDAGEAIAWLWHQRGLREVCAAVMVLNLLGGAFLIPLIVLVADRGGDAVTTGTVLAGAGIGGLIGALLSHRTGALLPPGKLLITVVTLLGAAFAAMTIPLGPWWPMVPLALFTLSAPALNVVMDVVIARMVPEGMLGRMDAILTIVSRGLAPLGPVLGGGLAALLGGSGALLVIGGLLLLTAAGAAAVGELRRFTGAADDVPAAS